MPNTKIVATLGPASDSPDVLRNLLSAGVDVFRLNASHGVWEDHAKRIELVRQAAAHRGKHTGILLDLQGPKIRLGKFKGGKATLIPGARFTITTETIVGDAERASTGYSLFANDVKKGDRVLLADGFVELRAISISGNDVHFEVIRGGAIGDNKGINLPGVKVSAPSMTGKDLSDLQAGLAAGVDMVALSFVRTADDVRNLRACMGKKHSDVPIIAKIEKPEGYDNVQEILQVAEGVMVARGDLGVEISLERVPPIQKSIIRRARREGNFVITATQMLESMIQNPTPTRAEVSDVANAIYDGTDAVMLSAETSVGAYPVETVQYMALIAHEAERSINKRGFQDPPPHSEPTTAQVVADMAYHAARLSKAAAVVVFTSTGRSARLVSRYRPPVPIFAVTPSERAARALSVCYGVIPIVAPHAQTTDQMLGQLDRMLIEQNLLNAGDTVVFVAGQPVSHAGTTNMMKVHRVGEITE
jgi:pyruvate kinase